MDSAEAATTHFLAGSATTHRRGELHRPNFGNLFPPRVVVGLTKFVRADQGGMAWSMSCGYGAEERHVGPNSKQHRKPGPAEASEFVEAVKTLDTARRARPRSVNASSFAIRAARRGQDAEG